MSVVCGGQALAADMGSLKDDPVVEVAPTWSAHYVGGSIGWGENKSDNTYTDTDGLDDETVKEHADGGLVSVILGFDKQVHQRYVIGAFIEYDLSDLERGSGDDALTIDRQLFIGGRLGVLMKPDLLAYVSGGYTRAHFDNEGWWTLPSGELGREEAYFDGWFIGGGFEKLLRGNISLRGEVRYSDFGNEATNTGDCGGGCTYVDSEDPEIWSARIGLNYRFGRDGRTAAGGVDEEAQSFISYHGINIGKNYQYGYSGVLMALNGDWNKDGLIFRTESVIGSYDYRSGGFETDADDRIGDVMLGYQIVRGNVSAILYAGMEIRDVELSPDDPTERLRGTETGFKVALDVETDDQAPIYFNLYSTYSTAFDTFAIDGRVGARRDRFTFGPEASFLREAGDDYYRVGAFVSMPVKLIPDWESELTFNGGYQFVGDDENGGGVDEGGSRSEGGYFGTKLVLIY